MTIRSAQQTLLAQLRQLYEEREAANITDWVMEYITGKRKTDRLLVAHEMMPAEWQRIWHRIGQELLTNKPVQYVLGEAWFAGLKFFVNEQVLIPRPETEELVEWLAQSAGLKNTGHKLLDIGTGSGCIPVVLKKKIPEWQVTALDTSAGALAIASKNAVLHKADIELLQLNFLDENAWLPLTVYDCIVSNPPYIRQSEKESMEKNVVAFEPGIALFVPDEDALLFYRKIALFAKTHLSKDGMIFLEINEALGDSVTELLIREGYTAELKKDLQGKDRMIKATWGT